VANAGIVIRLVEALRLEEAESSRLVELVQQTYAEAAARLRRVDAGVSFRVGAAAELGVGARVVRGFGALVVPAGVRTAEYAEAAGVRALTLGPAAGGEGRRAEFVVSEAALRTWPGSGRCMVGQLDHLLRLGGGADVVLGVLPLDAGLGVAPLHGFTVFDEAAVSVETFTRELTLSEADEVRAYLDVYAGIRGASVFGEEARELVESARRDVEKTLRSIQ